MHAEAQTMSDFPQSAVARLRALQHNAVVIGCRIGQIERRGRNDRGEKSPCESDWWWSRAWAWVRRLGREGLGWWFVMNDLLDWTARIRVSI